MAGRGPAPKPGHLRQRRNRVAGAATLVGPSRRVRRPKLDAARAWHPNTLEWWRKLWRSPMAEEYLESDVSGLLMLLELVEGFWRLETQQQAARRVLEGEPEADVVVEVLRQLGSLEQRRIKLMQEIRMQGALYGTTPIDRRRLQWEVKKAESAGRKPAPARPGMDQGDPRAALSLVK